MAPSTSSVVEPGEGVLHPVPRSLLQPGSSARAIVVLGWKGVGRRTLINHMVKDTIDEMIQSHCRYALMRLRWSELTDRSNALNLRKVQKRIVQLMGSEYRNFEQLLDFLIVYSDQERLGAFPEIASAIRKYVGRTYLLAVVEEVGGPMDLQQWREIGVPTREEDPLNRWLISSSSLYLCSGMNPQDLVVEYRELDLVPAWELIREEAADVAQTLAISGIRTLEVLECFFYNLLFSFSYDSGIIDLQLVRCWVAEGLVGGANAIEGNDPSTTTATTNENQDEEEEEARKAKAEADKAHAGMKLLDELLDRSMLEKHGPPTYITIPEHVRLRASQMVSRDRGKIIQDPLLSQVSKYLLTKGRDRRRHQPQQQQQQQEEELSPPTPQEWEGVERISLINQGITSLPEEPPRCPTLATLILKANSQLKDIPFNFFQHMTALRVLDLSFTAITSICTSTMPSLTLLYLRDCKSLEQIDLAGTPSLRFLSLSRSPVALLSLRGCPKLDTIGLYDLPKLVMLDLSDSGIREFPTNVLKLTLFPQLRRVDLLNTKRLRRFPWDKLERLPAELNIDQCNSTADGSNRDGACIYVSDSKFFLNFTKSAGHTLLERKNDPSRFHVYLSPCDVHHRRRIEGRNINDMEAAQPSPKELLTQFTGRKPFCYRDLCSKFAAPSRRRLDKHFELEGGNGIPEGLGNLLNYMESVFVFNNMFLRTLTDLNKEFARLKECHVQQCHHMEDVFTASGSLQNENLELLWVSDLRRLRIVCNRAPVGFTTDEFRSLKEVHLERCPMLEKVFPSHLPLPCLETLTISFCGKLKQVFYSVPGDTNANDNIKLHTIHLLELPRLLHIHEDHKDTRLPALEVLQVRGCWRLSRLPLLARTPTDRVVEVSGEQKWWNNLQWDHHDEYSISDKDHFRFRACPSFASATRPPTRHGRSRRRSRIGI